MLSDYEQISNVLAQYCFATNRDPLPIAQAAIKLSPALPSGDRQDEPSAKAA